MQAAGKAEKRRVVPMAIKLAVALRQLHEANVALGRIPTDSVVSWQLDHIPALGLRPFDPVTGQHTPHQHSPAHLEWLHTLEHKVKTTGRRGESDLSLRDGDQAKIAKVDRIVKKRAARDSPPEERPRSKPKAKIPSPPKKPRKAQKRASGYVRRGV